MSGRPWCNSGSYSATGAWPELTDILIGRSFETLKWMRTKGVRFQPSYGRQAFKVNGKYKFWGGLAVEAWGGGPGLVDLEHKAAVKAGIPIHYETPAVSLIEEDGVVRGVVARHKGRKVRIGAKAVENRADNVVFFDTEVRIVG